MPKNRVSILGQVDIDRPISEKLKSWQFNMQFAREVDRIYGPPVFFWTKKATHTHTNSLQTILQVTKRDQP